jgi:23S rRNA (adenine-N6)-dimethyltransferase
VSERRGTTERDRRRRSLGQNFLVDQRLIRAFVGALGPLDDELVLDIGAGTGVLTLELARRGATVWAVEPDPEWYERLRTGIDAAGLGDRVRPLRTTMERLRLPSCPFRVVANPPFGITTQLLARLLDGPAQGPTRMDLIVQREVAVKHATTPPVALRTAAWLPWWEFHLGPSIDRSAFRPRPSVDAAVLIIVPRTPPLLPHRLAPMYADALRGAWNAAAAPQIRANRPVSRQPLRMRR